VRVIGKRTLVVMKLIPHGRQTEVVITDCDLATEDLRKDHTGGWNLCLDNLERFL
jgi:Activator of Hsp90 ATPase homolog 1-like protein